MFARKLIDVQIAGHIVDFFVVFLYLSQHCVFLRFELPGLFIEPADFDEVDDQRHRKQKDENNC